MAFYDLSKTEREKLSAKLKEKILSAFSKKKSEVLDDYFSDEDLYIRKRVYLSTGQIYREADQIQSNIINYLIENLKKTSELLRQTSVNAAGEIGMLNFEKVRIIFDTALFDEHHKVRNAVIGSLKKMSQKNPGPVLEWAKKYINHPDTEIRREVCHGIELRGRTHPQDILPILKKLQFEEKSRVRKTLIHVLGQISYKKACLETVIKELKGWEDKELVTEAIEEILDVHRRYGDFSYYSQEEAARIVDEILNF